MSLFYKTLPVGLDLSDYSAEVLQLNSKNQITAFGRVVLEKGLINDGQIGDQAKLVSSLQTLFKKTRPVPLTGNRYPWPVVLSLPESKVFVRRLTLSRHYEAGELPEQIIREAVKILPLNPSQFYSDYREIETGEYIFIAVLKDTVDAYVELLNKAGFEPLALDIESASLARAVLDPKASTGPTIIMDLGARTSVLSLYDAKGNLNLSITIPRAGQEWTRAVARKFEVAEEEAEALKIKYGLSQEADQRLITALQEGLEPIVHEIREGQAYFESKRGQKVSQIILAGGSALLPGLPEYLESKVNCRVSLGQPLGNIAEKEILGQAIEPLLLANVIGLARRAQSRDPARAGFNFLPTGQKYEVKTEEPEAAEDTEAQKARPPKTRWWLWLVLAVVAAAAVGAYLWFSKTAAPEESGVNANPENAAPAAENADQDAQPPQNAAPAAKPAAQKVVINKEIPPTLVLRLNADHDSPGVGEVVPSETYTLIQEKVGWYKIQLNSQIQGWLPVEYAKKL